MKCHSLTQETTVRNEETLRVIADRVRHWKEYCNSVEEQQDLWNAVSDFFAPEIQEAMDYTDKLPSFRNCGGIAGRKQLLREEAELVIWERLLLGEEGAKDFATCIDGFRKAIDKKLKEYKSTAQQESVSVNVAPNRKRDDDDRCAVVANGKNITADLESRQKLGEVQETEEEKHTESMDQNAGGPLLKW